MRLSTLALCLGLVLPAAGPATAQYFDLQESEDIRVCHGVEAEGTYSYPKPVAELKKMKAACERAIKKALAAKEDPADLRKQLQFVEDELH